MAVTEAVSMSITTDSALLPFLQADFDAVNYLNSTLPTLTTSTLVARQSQTHTGNLAALSTDTQALLTRLSTQTARLSNTLTQLTDEIIRSGGRLAYEVELLRGEAIGLTDALETGLKDDLDIFTTHEDEHPNSESKEPDATARGSGSVTAAVLHLERLRTLTAVRERLDAVIRVFDGAMKWPIAPSEMAATSSSLISITAPTTDEETQSQEDKAKEFAKRTEEELDELFIADAANATESVANRIAELSAIAEVWKGTSEEKARFKVLESMQKLVEDRQRSSTNRGSTAPSALSARPLDHRYGNSDTRVFGDGSYNFLNSLRS